MALSLDAIGAFEDRWGRAERAFVALTLVGAGAIALIAMTLVTDLHATSHTRARAEIVLLAGLLVLGLTNFLLARTYTRHIRRRDRECVEALAKALDATSTERRRIATELHNGLVQDVSAAAMTISTTMRAIRTRGWDDEEAGSLDTVAETLRGSLGSLRTLLLDFYPADLQSLGLGPVLGDLAMTAQTRGLRADVDASPAPRPPLAVERLLFRVAQEALRNVTAHAHARRVSLRAGGDRTVHWLEVQDDGRGFDPSDPAPEGHIGLRALRDLVADAGGRLRVRSAPGEGTLIRAEVPLG